MCRRAASPAFSGAGCQPRHLQSWQKSSCGSRSTPMPTNAVTATSKIPTQQNHPPCVQQPPSPGPLQPDTGSNGITSPKLEGNDHLGCFYGFSLGTMRIPCAFLPKHRPVWVMEVQEKTTTLRSLRSCTFVVTALVWTCLLWHFTAPPLLERGLTPPLQDMCMVNQL